MKIQFLIKLHRFYETHLVSTPFFHSLGEVLSRRSQILQTLEAQGYVFHKKPFFGDLDLEEEKRQYIIDFSGR